MDRYAKAIVGALIGALGSYGAAMADGSGVTAGEWVAVAATFLAGLGLVWAVPNAPAQPAVVDGRYLGDTTPTVRRETQR